MFVLNAPDFDRELVARLARLMLNIESGTRRYEWGPDSRAAPHVCPDPGFLSIPLPAVAKDAPPVVADYCPTVGFVFYTPAAEPAALVDLLRQVKASLDESPDDHLHGYRAVEVAPHTILFHKDRTYSDTVMGFEMPRREKKKAEWGGTAARPGRLLQLLSSPISDPPPSQISTRAGFTWYFAPIGLAAGIRKITSCADFNALVASVFLDSFAAPSALESGEAVHELTPDLLGVPPLPAAAEKMLGPVACADAIIIYNAGRFEFAGRHLWNTLGTWRRPPRADERPVPVEEAALAETFLAANSGSVPPACALCDAPLWGVFFAIEDPLIAPFRTAVCNWCCGCLPTPRWLSAVPVLGQWGAAEACAATGRWAALLPLVTARVEAIPAILPGGKEKTFFVLEEGGASWVLEAREDAPITAAVPPCLYVSRLRNVRAAGLTYPLVAEIR